MGKIETLQKRQEELLSELQTVSDEVQDLQAAETQKIVQLAVKELLNLAAMFRFGAVQQSFQAIQDGVNQIGVMDKDFSKKIALMANFYEIADRDSDYVKYIVGYIIGSPIRPFGEFLKFVGTKRPGNPFLEE